MKLPHRINRRGYTLIEVLTAAVIVGASVSAATSLSTTMKMQEEMSWHVSVGINYQETACRLWQLGLTPAEVATVLPGTAGNRPLNDCIDSLSTITALSTTNQSGLGVMEGSTNTVNIANFSGAPAGSATAAQVYRPSTRGAADP